MIKKEIEYPQWWVVLIGVGLFIGISYWDSLERERYNRDFFRLGDRVAIEGGVSNYYSVKVWKNASAFELTNGQKVLTNASLSNMLYSPSSFYDLVEIGDYVKKPKKSDVIYLYKKKENYKEYYFFFRDIE